MISALGEGFANAPDVEAMNKTLLDNFNDRVGPGDEAWFVGDIAMGSLRQSLSLIKQLRCRNLMLVSGNHDSCHPMHGKYKRFVPLYEDAGFTILSTQVKTHVNGTAVKVCHFPYWEDFVHNTRPGGVIRQDKFSGLRPDDEGGWLIHGHTHSPERISKRRQIHVGVDAWEFFPVSEDDIGALISGS